MKRLSWFLLVIFLSLAVACGGDSSPTVEEITDEPVDASAATPATTPSFAGQTLIVMTHDSFSISEEILTSFEDTHGVTVSVLPAGDTGAALNQAILAKDNPLADVFFGVDNTFLGRALSAEIFMPYESPQLTHIPDSLQLDSSNSLLPVDYGDVCLNYDKAWFEENNVAVPTSLTDLTQPEYEGLLVVENPATSSPGLAFLLATIATFGTDDEYDYLDFWSDLRDNRVLVTAGWSDAYYGYFSAASAGERPLVVSYASSPAAEYLYADPPVESAPTSSIVADLSCFRQVEFVGILAGTERQQLAQLFVDYMLSKTFQEDIPLNMFVFPAHQEAELPQEFIDWAMIPDNPATLDPTEIDANREAWIEAWSEIVLR
ncbi:MAG TPA: thiamine ABC transporter substrate-binding protein [Anaerolineae bacterium]|nr:thiamine ABC transporter substrate-binding protein [Anaerolineae bacterium]